MWHTFLNSKPIETCYAKEYASKYDYYQGRGRMSFQLSSNPKYSQEVMESATGANT